MKFFESKYFRAFRNTFFAFACFHLVLLGIKSILERNIYFLNPLDIFEITYFFPNLFENVWALVSGFVLVLVVFFLFLRLQKK